MDNVVHQDGGYVLAPGRNVEGVVLLQQGPWPTAVLQRFHQVPWLDAASIRLPWRDLEPQDQQFNWQPFDRLLEEVRRYNAAHPQQRPRTLHIRVMGGRFCPKWFEAAQVRFYDTSYRNEKRNPVAIRTVLPYDNPHYLRQLREVYRAMHERYRDAPLVAVYHGTWSAGPWDEIFHPQSDEPLPPDYTPAKFVQGMLEQLDVLIDEWCMKGKVAELPYSGLYPPKQQIDITGPITARIVQRLGKRSPYLYIQSNGWGITSRGIATISWGHERDIADALGQVNLALQALGTNAGGGWFPQGDWPELVDLARQYDASYAEIYPPDLMPLDTKHHIVEAFTGGGGAEPAESGPPPRPRGYRPWLTQRRRVLHVREGVLEKRFAAPVGHGRPMRLDRILLEADCPNGTSVAVRARVHLEGGTWSQWKTVEQLQDLPAGDEAAVEVRLHTNDAFLTPQIRAVRPVWTPP